MDAYALSVSQMQMAVDGYIEQVLDTIDRFSQDEPVDPEVIHTAFKHFLKEASVQVGGTKEWQISLYALVAWTDEMLLALPWVGKEWWSNRVLEVEFFGTRVCSEKFFHWAQEIAQVPNHPSLRTYYVCVILGFRGIYGHASTGSPEAYGFPKSLPEWLRQMRTRLRSQAAMPMPINVQRRISGAEPRNLREHIVWWSIAATALLMLNVTAYTLLD